MISLDQVVAQISNKFFINIVLNLKIPINQNYDCDFLVTNDQAANILNKFRNHPSIVMVKTKKKFEKCFSFGEVTWDDLLYKKNNLGNTKASQQSDIPTKILKQNSDYFAGYFCVEISTSVFQNQCSHQI